MALSGSASGNYNENGIYTCVLKWSATQNISGNTSTVKAQLYIKKAKSDPYGTFNKSGTSKGSVTIDGTKYEVTTNFDLRSSAVGTEKLLASYSKTITHNANGAKSITISGTHTTGVNLGTKTLSLTANLDTIPRASSFSVGDLTMGTASTITVTKQSSSFTHRLYYTFGSKSNIEITSGAVSGNVSFTPPLSLASEVPNATSGTITIKCVTYNGSTQVGSASKSVKLSVPASVKPSVSSVTLTEAQSGLNAQFGAFIQGQSKLSGTVNTTTAYGSAIASYKVEINGAVYSSKTFTTGILKNSGSQTVKVTVTDKRGRTSNAYTTTYSVLAYTPPQITKFSVLRYKDATTQDDNGEFVKVFINGTITPLSNKNTRALKYRYRLTSQSTYTEASITISGYSFTFESGLLSGFNSNSSYTFEADLQDYFTDAITVFSLPTAFVTLDIYKDGTGVAVGKVAEDQNCFEVGFDKTYLGRHTYLGKRTDFQKRIHFENLAPSTDAANNSWKHNCYIYGGQRASEVSIGVYDPQNEKRAWAYMQSRKRLYTDAELFEWQNKSVDRVQESTNANGVITRVWADGYCVISGYTSVTPSAANTATAKAITFGKTFKNTPIIQVTPNTGAPGTAVLGVGFSNPTTTGCNLVVTRTNTVATTLYWTATGFINI